MTTRNKLFAALLICLISSLADPANALEVRNNMAFSTVNQNPWVPGASFEQEFTFDNLRPSFGPIDLPTLHGNPVSALVDFLDVDEYLPFDADASVGGSVGGSAGLTFRYYVTGGRLNMKYPARTSLDIAATLPGTLDTVVAGRTSAIHSAFLPGVSGVTRPISLVSDAAGLGYAEQSVPGFTMETFRDPEFSTTNPYAAAAVDLGFDVRVNAFAKASVKSFGECITCVTKRFSFGTDADVTLAAVSPDGVSVAAGAYELEFDQDIDFLGIGSVRASYPNVQVHSQPLAPDASLHGFASQHAITVQGHLEKLVPVIGPFLSNSIGPFGYTLLSVEGGPSLNVYQDLTFTPQPSVELKFNEPVLHKDADSVFRPTNSFQFALGDDVEWKPIMGSLDQLRISPTYFLNNTFRNETGFTLGIDVDVDVLELQTPLGDIGPVFHFPITADNLARVPLYEHSFQIPLGAITGNEIVLNKVSAAVGNLAVAIRVDGSNYIATNPLTQQVTYRMVMNAAGDGLDFNFLADVTGTETLVPLLDGSGNAQTILVADEDVIVTPSIGVGDQTFIPFGSINVGTSFCISCMDSSSFFDAANPALVDDEGELLFLSKLFAFADGLVNIGADPILSQNNFVFNQTIIPTEIFPTETIAFPGDYNHNGEVDAADYVVWRATLGQSGASLAADGDGSGTIDQADYDLWRTHFGQTVGGGAGISSNAVVPEPSGVVPWATLIGACLLVRRARSFTPARI